MSEVVQRPGALAEGRLMRIAVLGGGGAMGGLFGGWLAEAGHDVALIDVSAPAVEAINRDGLASEEKDGTVRRVRVPATSDPASVGPVDLVVNFVKCYHTEAAVRSALPMLGRDTAMLTLQNGWGNAPRIQAIAGDDRVLVGLTYHSATLLSPGRVKHPGTGMTTMGELDGRVTARLERAAEAFRAAGFETTVSTRVLDEVWKKLALNVCTLPTSALLRFEADQLIEHDGTLETMRALLEEVVAVAGAEGIRLDVEERWEAITGLLRRAVGAKASMLQDVEARRRTEIDVINGAIVEAGRRNGVPTPHNDAMVWLVRALEETFAEPPKAD
jgi:2-dehydropantoate 2-reductase